MSREFDFYVVPTPIGNISDITYRAVEILKSVDIIACEDTRVSQKLMNHYGIKTKCISYHKYNEKERAGYFLKELSSGKKIALISDAGTPMICDPGGVVIEELLSNGYTVTSLPGACAVTTFLSRLPRKTEEFTFIGFIPRTEGLISEIVSRNHENIVFYDSPERVIKTLDVIKKVRGDVKISLGRELSKLFEEVVTDKISNIILHFEDGIKGEIVCMIYADEFSHDSEMLLKIRKLKEKGFRDKEISSILSLLFDVNKNDIYKMSLAADI